MFKIYKGHVVEITNCIGALCGSGASVTRVLSSLSLTRMLLQAAVMVAQAVEVGKSRGREGRERSLRSGVSPPWDTNSLMWSSVELLLRMESTKWTCGGEDTHRRTRIVRRKKKTELEKMERVT